MDAHAIVGRIGAGDYIGEIGMLTGAPHAATVTALTPCTVFELCQRRLPRCWPRSRSCCTRSRHRRGAVRP